MKKLILFMIVIFSIPCVLGDNVSIGDPRSDIFDGAWWSSAWESFMNDELSCSNYVSLKRCLEARWENANRIYYQEQGWDNTTTGGKIFDATENLQVGVDEYNYEFEKELVLININEAWVFIHLLMEVLLELIKLIFYLGMFYLFVIIIVDLIPNAFIRMKDSILEMYTRSRK